MAGPAEAADAAVVLVDLRQLRVVDGNRAAAVLTGGHPLPLPLGEWGRRAGLLGEDGQDLFDASGLLSRVVRGDVVADVPVHRPGAPDRLGPMWMTVHPLDGSGTSADLALVTVSAVSVASGERRCSARLSLLLEAGAGTVGHDAPAALRRLASLLVRELVTWMVVLRAEETLSVVAAAGQDLRTDLVGARVPMRRLASSRTWADREDGGPPDEHGWDDDPLGALLSDATTGAVGFDLDADPEADLDADSVTARVRLLLRPHLHGRCAARALAGRGGVQGAVLFGPGRHPLEPDDVALLDEFARRAGSVLDGDRLHAYEHEASESMARSMLPEQAVVPGLDAWTFYAPSVTPSQVGGDWYDVLQLDSDVAGLVIGAVVGQDAEAVAVMGQLRSVVRSYAGELEDPAHVLMRVDQLAHGMRVSRPASAVYATLTRLDGDDWTLEWSRAGHLPPLLRRGTQVEVLTEATGTPLGLEDGPRSTAERVMHPGDVLVLFTDGLVERRHRPLPAGVDALVEALSVARSGDAAGIGEELLAALDGDSPEDDIALVIVRLLTGADETLTPDLSTPRQRRWQLAPDLSAVGRARHAVRRACVSWRRDCGDVAEMVVSELVANAVLHGYGQVGVRLVDTGAALRIEVEDSNPAQPRVRPLREGATGGQGLRIIERLARWGVERSTAGKVVWAEIPLDARLRRPWR